MLSALHIRNYVLIDSLDIDFPEGLVIITGQTGAGKSILLGALGLLLGAKADASVIGEGADKCIVEAEFDADESLKATVEEQDVDWDSGHLVIRRVVNDSGRSRSFVNDCPVSIQLLQDLASRLVDIHSQHSNLLLKDRAWQLKLLDHFASCDGLRAEISELWQQMRRLETELRKDRERLESLSSDREYNEERMRRLESANLREGELEELEEEHRSLSHAEEIKELIGSVLSLRDSEELSLPSRLRDAVKSLSKAAAYIPSFESLEQRLDSARIEIDDILDEAGSCGEKISLSRDRLEEVESRLSLLYDLFKRYSCTSVGELIAKKEKYSVSVGGISELEEKIAAMEAELKVLAGRYSDLCGKLHASRTAAAPALSKNLLSELRRLELDSAVFEISLHESEATQYGTDRIDFLFSSTGSNPVPVEKCASGGEISRIMLCLKASMAQFEGMPTMIFDEIDSGVSGSVAAAMGSKICSMGENMQVFAITHLPQVAAKGKAHYLVSKSANESGRTVSSIEKISADGRIREIARLLSGASLTPEALANAKVLLSE